MKKTEEIKRDFEDKVIVGKKRFNLLFTMVKRNVKTMYRESVLGVIWTVLNPLLTMFVLSFVYSQVFGRDMEEIKYPVYVLSGMITYNSLFRAGSNMGLTSIVDKRNLVMQTQIPITVYPRVSVYTALVNYGFSFIALLVVMLIYKQPFHLTLLMTPVLLLALMLFTMGTTFVVSTVYVYFRDIKNIYNVFVTLLMYMTPIFYTIETLNNELASKVLKFNPLYYYVEYFRQLIMGHVPSWESHLLIFGMGLFVYAVGYAIITGSKKKFVFHL